MIDSQGRVFGRFNLVDTLIILVIALALLGAGLAKAGKAGVSRQLRGEATAEFDLFIRGVLSDPGIFQVGDKTFITIRNQPYAGLTIQAVKVMPRMIALPAGAGVKALPDPAEPYAKDVVMTLRDKAQVTDDAVVMGGNKIKVGLPIDIEGKFYRLRGSIIAVRLLDQPKP